MLAFALISPLPANALILKVPLLNRFIFLSHNQAMLALCGAALIALICWYLLVHFFSDIEKRT